MPVLHVQLFTDQIRIGNYIRQYLETVCISSVYSKMLRLFVFSLILAVAFGQTNYCLKLMCPAGVTHIGCQNR